MIRKGGKYVIIWVKYVHTLCLRRGIIIIISKGSGSYILEFKYKEKHWAIDATKEDNSFGHLINHSKKI